MKRIIIFSLVSFLVSSTRIISQTCEPTPFLTQESIDNFQINYPGCTEITGTCLISGDDISNLNGLGDLVKINTLKIENNPMLDSIVGLNNLLNVNELWIKNNNNLTSLHGLENIDSIPEVLWISSNDILASLDGLNNLKMIGGSIFPQQGFFSMRITGNNSLTNLSGLNSLVSTEGIIQIYGNNNLETLNGLENLDSIGGVLSIGSNDALTSLTGLDSLSSIAEGLFIQGNDALTSLTGLDNLSSIGGELHLGFNDALTSLIGLDNLDDATITNLTIQNSVLLSTCEVQSICDYLAIPSNPAIIDGNASGCNNRVEVEDACEAVVNVNSIKPYEVQIHPNPTYGVIHIDGINEGQVEVFNSLGKVLMKNNFTFSKIDLSALPNGLYVLLIQSGNQKISKRIIKL